MTLAASRSKCLAGGGPLERRVRRPRSARAAYFLAGAAGLATTGVHLKVIFFMPSTA
jgi:hypothetical protein